MFFPPFFVYFLISRRIEGLGLGDEGALGGFPSVMRLPTSSGPPLGLYWEFVYFAFLS